MILPPMSATQHPTKSRSVKIVSAIGMDMTATKEFQKASL